MLQTVFIVLGILIVVFGCLAGVGLVLKKKFQAQHDRVMDKFAGQNVLLVAPGANYFGVESKGMGQLRGNGILVLTDLELYYEMLVGGVELSVPVARLAGIETVRSHLGKTKAVPLLKVRFQAEDGSTDSVAWAVRDVPQWIEAIQRTISEQSSRPGE